MGHQPEKKNRQRPEDHDRGKLVRYGMQENQERRKKNNENGTVTCQNTQYEIYLLRQETIDKSEGVARLVWVLEQMREEK